MDYSLCDLDCPFNINNNYSFTSARVRDSNAPLNLEDNGSKILLVFEAPGYYEWVNGSPIYDIEILLMQKDIIYEVGYI